MGLCPLLASLGPGAQHVGQTLSALLPLSMEQRGSLGAAEKLSIDGTGGWGGLGAETCSCMRWLWVSAYSSLPPPTWPLGAPSASTLSTSHWVLVGVSLLLRRLPEPGVLAFTADSRGKCPDS